MSSNDLFRMPNKIFDMNMRLSATELTVLAALYSLRGVCYKNKKYVRISQKSIATMTGLTPKTISRIIDKLNRLNLILEVRRYFVDEHKLGTYHYTLPIVNFKYFLVNSKIFKIKLTASEFRMYLYCCKCADSRTMQFWNSFNDICNQLNLHRSSVIAILKSLIKKDLISRYRVKKKYGSYADNYYQINTILIHKPKIQRKKRRRYSSRLSIFPFRFVLGIFKSYKGIVHNLHKTVKCFSLSRGSPKIYTSVRSTHYLLNTNRRKNIKLYLKYRCNLEYYGCKKIHFCCMM